MVDCVRGRDEASARFQDSPDLGKATIEIRQVVKHPGSHDDVELPVAERKVLDVADPRVDSLRPLDFDHPLRLVDADHLCAELGANPFRQLPFAASDLEHPLRLRLRNSCEGELSRIVALGVGIGRLAGPEIVLALVLRSDEGSLVDPLRQPLATFGSLLSSAAISSRIFSSERRMSRDTCICEMPTCWAI